MNIYPGRNDSREVIVRFNKKDREIARAAIRYIEESLLPPGYVLDDERIHKNRRAGRGGSKLDVTVVIFFQDSREYELDEMEWLDRLEHVEDL